MIWQMALLSPRGLYQCIEPRSSKNIVLFTEKTMYAWPLNLEFSLQFVEVCHSASTKKDKQEEVNKAEFSLLQRLPLNGLYQVWSYQAETMMKMLQKL